MCKYELPTSRLSKVIVWQTDRHTDRVDRHYKPRHFAGVQKLLAFWKYNDISKFYSLYCARNFSNNIKMLSCGFPKHLFIYSIYQSTAWTSKNNMHQINTIPKLNGQCRDSPLSMANTSDNNTKRRKNNTQNKMRCIHTKLITCLK